MATGTITDKINNVVALLVDQCNCGTPSEIKAAFQELQDSGASGHRIVEITHLEH